jgi:hypothetical protein
MTNEPNRLTDLCQGAVAVPKRGPGRPRTDFAAEIMRDRPVVAKLVRRRKKQLCPVPNCKNPAAPVFGMVCAKHKGVPKAKIAGYRKARAARAAK